MAYHYALFLATVLQTHWVTLQAKYSTRSALASTLKSCTEAITCVLQIITYAVVEKWRTKENKCKLWENHDATFGAALVGKKKAEQSNAEQ